MVCTDNTVSIEIKFLFHILCTYFQKYLQNKVLHILLIGFIFKN
jgi:hypothetical protein